jgi:hypothetical protein
MVLRLGSADVLHPLPQTMDLDPLKSRHEAQVHSDATRPGAIPIARALRSMAGRHSCSAISRCQPVAGSLCGRGGMTGTGFDPSSPYNGISYNEKFHLNVARLLH